MGRGARGPPSAVASLAGGRGPARGPPPPAAVEVNNEDRVAELTRSHADALMKADAKRALLQKVLVNKNQLLRLARDEGTTDLQDQLEKTYFSNRRGRGDDGPDRTGEWSGRPSAEEVVAAEVDSDLSSPPRLNLRVLERRREGERTQRARATEGPKPRLRHW